jgi:hypothetical protein
VGLINIPATLALAGKRDGLQNFIPTDNFLFAFFGAFGPIKNIFIIIP